MKTSLFTSFFFVLSFLSVQAQEVQFPPVPQVPVVAHRGFSAIAPENTISSLKKAIDIGVSGAEFDVYSTIDGLLFLTHDSNLKRTTGLDCITKEVKSEQLFTLDFGSWKGSEYTGEKVATYDAALQLLKDSQTTPVIEVKENGFAKEIVDGLRKYDLVDKAIVIDFNKERVKEIRQLEPNLCCAWLCSFDVAKETNESMTKKIIETLKGCNTNVVDVQFQAVSPEFLEILDKAGIKVMCWTVDDPVVIERLMEWGTPSITTNRPDLALEIFKKRQEESTK